MNSADRIAFFGSMIGTLLSSGKERSYVTFDHACCADEYVQYKLHRGRVYGEVGSRCWREPERPLTPEATDRLAALGFTGGGAERNYARDGLQPSAPELAALTESLFHAAYDLDGEFAVVVHLNLNDVTMPRAVPFTRELIMTELRNKGVQFLTDQDGDAQADFTCAGSDERVTIRFTADGDENSIYRVWSGARRRPVPSRREEAVERCNTWNSTRRWPTASVLDGDGAWQVVTNCNLDLAPGVTPPLFARFTEHAVRGALDFWEWIAAADAAQTAADGDDAA